MSIDITTLVSKAGYSPKAWQTGAPAEVYGGNKPPVTDSADLQRILGIPRRPQVEHDSPTACAMIDMVTAQFARPNAACKCRTIDPDRFKDGKDGCITRLQFEQAWALYEIAMYAGCLAPIAVGGGKTIIGLLGPLAMPRCKIALLVVPPTLAEQLIREYRMLAEHFQVPGITVMGSSPYETPKVEGQTRLYVLPYSWLSKATMTVWLDELAPDTVFADEADKLANPQTAGTSRIMRYARDHPNTRHVFMSGSITDDSLTDYAHLAALALRGGSPLPIDPEVAKDWARAIDPSDWPAPMGALAQLCDPRDGTDEAAETVYEGYHRRLVQTPGVVCSTRASIDTPLQITERLPPPIPNTPRADPRALGVENWYPAGQWPGVADCLARVRDLHIRPDGEELLTALEWSACARQLSCGFFYRWKFPRGEKREVIDEWREARKEWRKELRRWIAARDEHKDSELLGQQAAMRGWGELPPKPGLPVWKAMCWQRWRIAKPTVQHETEAILLDDYLARDAAEWGRTHRGVIWYESAAFGAWVARLSGLALHTGGPGAASRIFKEDGKHSIVASISSHGRGRDGLQRKFHDQLIAHPPASGARWEQLLGRLSRKGQTAPLVTGELYAHTRELRKNVEQALARARYVTGTIGAAQKLTTSLVWDDDDCDEPAPGNTREPWSASAW